VDKKQIEQYRDCDNKASFADQSVNKFAKRRINSPSGFRNATKKMINSAMKTADEISLGGIWCELESAADFTGDFLSLSLETAGFFTDFESVNLEEAAFSA
jgi:hypothetical protein